MDNIEYIIVLLLVIIIIFNFLLLFKLNRYKIIDNFNNVQLPYFIHEQTDSNSPWGVTEIPYDKKAQWIWYTDLLSDGSVPITKYNDSLNYNLKINSDTIIFPLTLYVICDNSCLIYINKKYIGTCSGGTPNWQTPSTFIINSLPNNNIFNFVVANMGKKGTGGNPGGFICSLQDSEHEPSILFNSKIETNGNIIQNINWFVSKTPSYVEVD